MREAIEEHIKDMNTLNSKYKAIIVLENKLTEKKIPHELLRVMDGWKIAYPNDEQCVFDVVEHRWSHGQTEDLMEAYGDGIEDVIGFMDIDTALSHFERVHNSYNACIDELLGGEHGE